MNKRSSRSEIYNTYRKYVQKKNTKARRPDEEVTADQI